MRSPYICFDFFLTLGGLFLVWFLVLKISKLFFESEFPLLGGLFYKTFWFEASLYMFLIFWNFRGSFWSSSFGFWKFRNCILNHNLYYVNAVSSINLYTESMFIFDVILHLFSIFTHYCNVNCCIMHWIDHYSTLIYGL